MQPLYGKGFQLRQGFDGQVACDRSASFRLLPPSSAFFRVGGRRQALRYRIQGGSFASARFRPLGRAEV
jgi:hypothetical protein